MKTTRIDLEGRTGHYAELQRKVGPNGRTEAVAITLLTPERPNGERLTLVPDPMARNLRRMAFRLHEALEGYRGTNSDVAPHFQALATLLD